jgi:hypothetical protein
MSKGHGIWVSRDGPIEGFEWPDDDVYLWMRKPKWDRRRGWIGGGAKKQAGCSEPVNVPYAAWRAVTGIAIEADECIRIRSDDLRVTRRITGRRTA